MKKTLLTLTLLASTGASAQEIPEAFIGTWGTGDSCENPATIEKEYIATEQHMAPMFVERIAPINDEKIRVFATKTNQGTVSKDNWTLTKANGYLIIEDQQGRQRFLKPCQETESTNDNSTDDSTIYTAPTSRWMTLGEKPDMTLMIDTVSKQRGSIWIKIIFKKPQIFSGKPTDYVIANKQYDCARRTGGTVQMNIYPKKGQPIQHSTPLNHFKSVQPESTEEEFMRIACKP